MRLGTAGQASDIRCDVMDDAELVASAIAGSPDAFAAVYDRYVDRIFDYARSVLRSDADAADVTQDTFLAASQRLEQLRDPSRLRPWLYAIARSHSFRTLRERQRVHVSSEIDEAADMTSPDGEIDAQRLVWAAAAGLTASDRDILDLHLRQGLDGRELGEVLGVSANAANVALHRVRARLEQSVGAVLLAKTSKQECAELDDLMVDGLNALARKRIARHLETCATCDDRRRAMTSPGVLFAATPATLAPLMLRDSVLGSIGSESSVAASASIDWRADGFPTPDELPSASGVGPGTGGRVGPDVDRARQRVRRTAIVSSVAMVLLAVVGVVFMLRGPTFVAGENAERRLAPIATASERADADLPDPIPSTTTTNPLGTTRSAIPPNTVAPVVNVPVSPTSTVEAVSNSEPALAPPPTIAPDTDPPTATETVPVGTTVPVTTVPETVPVETTVPVTTVPETVPVVRPVISLVEVVCASTMQVVVDIEPAEAITGTFETDGGLSQPLVAHPTVVGRFTSELDIGEGRVTPFVVATGPGGTDTLTLDDCIVIG